ncbi:hypothetical protein MNBD_NITROSPINAE05-833 [hydrothermal vent metagenome]|uniref:DUF2231 domain-containing protein n=1 Tax=hydrothermal vent metagenome TaxID=652676 RepID=A0A3B1DBI7_9ZZZZ
MFDLPLHPIAVHFPIVLGIILPVVALAVWWAIRKDYLQQKAWVLVVFLALAYGVSSFVAVELGEDDEDKVEKVVSEKVFEEHEEAGELIPWVASGLFLISLAGFLPKNSNRMRLALVVLSLAAVIPLANTGHTGGKLVYQYGAANAHLSGEYKALVESGKFYVANAESEDHESDDDDDH